MLSKNGKFAVSFKLDQVNLYIYERKYYHSFIVKLDNKDFEGAIAKTFKNGCFILGYKKSITFFNKKKESRFSIDIDDIEEDDLEIISLNMA